MQINIRWIAILMGVMGFAGAVNAAEDNSSWPPLSYVHAVDMPSIPAQETPIVLAQTTPSEEGQPDYIFKDCQETENGGDPRSAMRSVDPVGMLAV